MRTLTGFIFGVVVTIGVAFVHDTVATAPPAKPLVNWDAVQDSARGVVVLARDQWNRLMK